MEIYNLKKEKLLFKDNRGWMGYLAEFANRKSLSIKNIHLGSISPGGIRANHLHKQQIEWFFVFGGKALIAWKENGKKKTKKISERDFLVFEFNKNCLHAVKNIDTKEIYVCAFANKKNNFQKPDRFIEKIIE